MKIWGLLDLRAHQCFWSAPQNVHQGQLKRLHSENTAHRLMPQSHPTTGPVRFLSPVRFLARKAEWSARRNFTSVLFPWSHQATGPVRLDTSAICILLVWLNNFQDSQVPRAMHVQASYGPRSGIFNVFHILQDPYGTRAWPARVPHGAPTDT